MKIVIQHVSDSSGKILSIQLQLKDWEKLITRLKKYKQTLKIETDLKEAFEEVAQLRKSKQKKEAK